jgi:hypothetical protein
MVFIGDESRDLTIHHLFFTFTTSNPMLYRSNTSHASYATTSAVTIAMVFYTSTLNFKLNTSGTTTVMQQPKKTHRRDGWNIAGVSKANMV